MGRADRARRERPSRRLSFPPRRPAAPAAPCPPGFAGRFRRLAPPAGLLRLRALTLALALAGAAGLAAPAQAQSTDPIWSATMTVGEASQGGRGYHATGAADATAVGSLSENMLMYNGVTSVFDQVMKHDDDGNTDANKFVFQAGNHSFHESHANGLVLEVAGVALPFSGAESRASNNVRWSSTWLATNASSLDNDNFQTTLAVGNTVAVCLRTADQICPSSTSTVSTDAKLSALALTNTADSTAVGLTPVFASGTTSYTAAVANGVSRITVTPTFSESNATVEYLDADDVEITDRVTGTTALDMDLEVGANTVKVKVTAQDGNTTETYTVVVTRASAGAAPVWSTTMTVGVTSPGTAFVTERRGFGSADGSLVQDSFTIGTTDYRMQSLEAGAPSERWVNFVLDTIWTDVDDYTLEFAGEEFPLSEATRVGRRHQFTKSWVATNAPSLDEATYKTTLPVDGTVAVCLRTAEQTCPSSTSTASTDATLSALALTNTADSTAVGLTPVFASGTTSYTAAVANGVSRITVTPTFSESNATVEYLDADDVEITDRVTGTTALDMDLEVGANTVKVKVTAQDGNTTETYTVVVTRAAAGAAPIWSTTMTVGEASGGRGYHANTPAGALSESSLTYNSVTSNVNTVFKYSPDSIAWSGALEFLASDIDHDFDGSHADGLVLEVAGVELPFSSASRSLTQKELSGFKGL